MNWKGSYDSKNYTPLSFIYTVVVEDKNDISLGQSNTRSERTLYPLLTSN